ncbi:hypothetical protein T484DRAFT_1758027 [Baffinella frigidus]|nr:hypothetical protein T484DRAFT_1758027 [Cryptophyta sp. CCMP2293]
MATNDAAHKQLMESVRMRSIRNITTALNNGADVNELIPIHGVNGIFTSALREAVKSKYVNGVVYLLDHGAAVDNRPNMWDSAISNKQSTEIFRRLFATLKQQIRIQSSHLQDGEIVERVWEYLDEDRTGHIEHNIAIHGNPAMLSAALDHGMRVDTPGSIPVVYALFTHIKSSSRFDYSVVGPDVEEKTRMLLAAGTRKFPVPTGLPSLLSLAIMTDTSCRGDLVRICLDDRHCEDVNHEEIPLRFDQGTFPTQQTTALGHLVTKGYRDGVAYLETFNFIFMQLVEAGADVLQMSNGRMPLLLAVQACVQHNWRHLHNEDVMKVQIGAVKDILAHMTREEIRMPMSHKSHSLIAEACSPEIFIESRLSLLKMLLKSGADPNAPDGPTGETPLYTVVRRSLDSLSGDSGSACEDMATVLLSNGTEIDIDRPNTNGQTVAHLITENVAHWSMGFNMYRLFETRFNGSNMSRRKALGSVLHPRLGASSHMRDIPDELMRLLMSREYIPLSIPPIEEVFGHRGRFFETPIKL